MSQDQLLGGDKTRLNDVNTYQISDWINTNSSKLLKIGYEYEQYNRQIYHFLYEIVALFHTFTVISNDNQQEILNDANTALKLYHNRILAEVLSGYSKKGATVELYPSNNTRKPDLLIGNILIDIKTVLLVDPDRRLLMQSFAHKLRHEIIERESKKQQVGKRGSLFIGIWSGIISSLIYTAYNAGIISNHADSDVQLYATLPPLNEGKATFVLPSLHAFENNYIVFNRDEVCDIIDYLAKEGYVVIDQRDSMQYLAITNIRKGCEFGVTGTNPRMTFKLR